MKGFPEEFRREVVEIARSGREPRKKIAEDFGISLATLSNCWKADGSEYGTRDGVTRDQVREMEQLRRRTRPLGQEHGVFSACGSVFVAGEPEIGWHPKMM